MNRILLWLKQFGVNHTFGCVLNKSVLNTDDLVTSDLVTNDSSINNTVTRDTDISPNISRSACNTITSDSTDNTIMSNTTCGLSTSGLATSNKTNSINNSITDGLNTGDLTTVNELSTNSATEQAINMLKKDIQALDCGIKHTARNTVIFDGDINSKIMLIGEAPGESEDIQGKPFVGQSGMLLNNMLEAINLKRTDVIISNIVFWRPPGNRNPSMEEIALCLPFVKRLISIIQPKAILLLGSVAVHSLLNNSIPISKCRGTINKIMEYNSVATYHPAYLLRSSSQKKLVFDDLILFSQLL